MTTSAPETTREDQPALDADVIVVGGGNAAFTAAHAAAVRGRKVLLLEKAPKDEFGGNSYYTAGATRIAPANARSARTSAGPNSGGSAATSSPPAPTPTPGRSSIASSASRSG